MGDREAMQVKKGEERITTEKKKEKKHNLLKPSLFY